MYNLNKDKGILTIAYGNRKYIKFAINLATSLNLCNKSIPKAIVTDSDDPKIKELFDIIIPLDSQFGKGLSQKLSMYDYSPFEETIFIDSDCLAIRNIEFVFKKFVGKNVSVVGNCLKNGKWLGIDIGSFTKKHQLPYVIIFNGGLYYFKSNSSAKQIFSTAKSLIDHYDTLGFDKHKLGLNEEPLMSYAMAQHHETPYQDKGHKSMYTPIGIQSTFYMEALAGECRFKKYDQEVCPSVVHFSGHHTDTYFYHREVLKIKLYTNSKLSRKVISTLVNAGLNPFYMIYVFIYRMKKRIVNGKKVKFIPLMPFNKKMALK